MAILEEIGGFLKSGSNLPDLADYLGTGVDDVKRPVGAAVSLLVAAVAKRSQTETGAAALFDTVKGAGGAALEHVGAPFGQEAQVDVGETLADALLGGRREEIENGLAEKSGMAVDQIQDLLPAMAPPVVAAMGRRVSRERLGRSSLLAELEADRSTMEREGLQSLLNLLEDGDEDADAFHFAEVMNRFNASGGMNHLLPAAQPLQKSATPSEDSVYTAISTTPEVGATTTPTSEGVAAGAVAGVGAVAAGGAAAAGSAMSGGSDTKATDAGGAIGAPSLGGSSGDDEFYGRPADNRWLWILGGLLGLLLLLLLVWQCGGDDDGDNGTTTEPTTSETTGGEADPTAAPAPEGLEDGKVLATAQAMGSFGQLLSAVEAANLTAQLESTSDYTLFAPTDEAFAAVPESLRNDPEALRQILEYHVVGEVLSDASLANGQLTTLAGAPLNVAVADGGSIRINGANLTVPNNQAFNGVFHVVDQVLIPPSMWPRMGANVNEILGLQNITFESGSATVTAEGAAILDQAAEFFLNNPHPPIEIAGHTDSSGDPDSNQALSQQRAEGVLTYLADKGVDTSLFAPVGYGDVNPIADNETPEGQAANRRIEFNFG